MYCCKKLASSQPIVCNFHVMLLLVNEMIPSEFGSNLAVFRYFRDAIRIPRVENRIPRIRDNYHRVSGLYRSTPGTEHFP